MVEKSQRTMKMSFMTEGFSPLGSNRRSSILLDGWSVGRSTISVDSCSPIVWQTFLLSYVSYDTKIKLQYIYNKLTIFYMLSITSKMSRFVRERTSNFLILFFTGTTQTGKLRVLFQIEKIKKNAIPSFYKSITKRTYVQSRSTVPLDIHRSNIFFVIPTCV